MTAPPRSPEKAITLALSLSQAESAIEAFSAGQIDAIVDAEGKTYLLRTAQERLRQNEARLRTVLDSVSEIITVVNRAGAVVSQNRAANLMLGYGPDRLVGLSLFEFIHEEDVPRFYSAFFNVIEGFRPQAIIAFRLRLQDGSYRLLEATVNQLRDVSVTCIVLSARDLTRGRGAQEEVGRREVALVEAAQAKDQFLAMLSHELRNPLAPISMGIADLQEDGRFAEALPTLAMMKRNLELQTRLLDELMDYTRIGQHKVRLRPETVDTHESRPFRLGSLPERDRRGANQGGARPSGRGKLGADGRRKTPAGDVEPDQERDQVLRSGQQHHHHLKQRDARPTRVGVHRPRHWHRTRIAAVPLRRLPSGQPLNTSHQRWPGPRTLYCQGPHRSAGRNIERREQRARPRIDLLLTLQEAMDSPNAPEFAAHSFGLSRGRPGGIGRLPRREATLGNAFPFVSRRQ